MGVDKRTYMIAVALASATLCILGVGTDEFKSTLHFEKSAPLQGEKIKFRTSSELKILKAENDHQDSDYVGNAENNDKLTSLIAALRNGDSDPRGAVVAAETHNKNVPLIKGCKTQKTKIVNIGLPRTGTLSFIRVMSHKFNVAKTAACHQLPKWPVYVNEIYAWQANPKNLGLRLKKAIQKCEAIADIPNFALYRSFQVSYPSTRFVMTVRGKTSWLNSTKILMESWRGKLPRAHMGFIKKYFKVDNSLGWQYRAYDETWERHLREALEYFGNNVLLLPVELSDSAKLNILAAFLGCEPTGIGYPRAHVGNKWKTK